MKLLLVSATHFEVRPFLHLLSPDGPEGEFLSRYKLKDASIDLLVPGVGMLVTAYHMGRQMAAGSYDMAINAGIAGSFRPGIPIGSVVEVTEDCVTELGAEEEDRLVSVFDLGLADPDAPPYRGGRLVNNLPVNVPALQRLPKVAGSTVNTIHGSKEGIRRVKMNSRADIESMEGAAFLYSCLFAGIPNTQIRSISNFVEERDKAKWDVKSALKNLNKVLEEVVGEIVKG
jgi:futalosine hydrolase